MAVSKESAKRGKEGAKRDLVLSLLIGLCAFTMWATGDAFMKMGTDRGASAILAIGINGLISALFIMLKTALSRKSATTSPKSFFRSLVPKAKKTVLLRAAISILSAYGFYTGYKLMPLTTAYALEFIAPFLIALGGVFFLGEKLSGKQVSCILVGFCGAIITLDPAALFQQTGNIQGYLATLLGTTCFAATQLFNRHLTNKESSEAIMFPTALSFTALGLGLEFPLLLDLPATTIAFLCAAAFCSLTGAYLILRAVKRAPAHLVGSLHFTQLIPGAIYGYLIWGHIPTFQTIGGSAVIIAATLALTRASAPDEKAA